MFNLKVFLVVIVLGILFISHGSGIVNLQEYCNSFDSNFRPIICVLKQKLSTQTQSSLNSNEENNNVNSHNRYHHRNPDYWQEDSEDEDCSCELWCFPENANSTIPLNITSLVASRYTCRSCGTECWISSSSQYQQNSICSCAVLGSSLNTTCTCTALCATFRYEESSEANCIFNVNGLMDMRLLDERRPYTCDCRKSKAAEFNSNPFFVCICQRTN